MPFLFPRSSPSYGQIQNILNSLYPGAQDPLLAARQAGTVRPGTAPAFGFPTAPTSTGALPGLPAYGGSPAAGRIPQVSDPTTTAAAALTGNLANMPNLQTLFNNIGDILVPEFTDKQRIESQNIADLLSGKFEVPEAFRRVAEMGTQMGPGGGESDAYKTAEILFGRRMAEEAKAMGAKRFSEAIARSKGVLDLEKFLQTPEQRQQWQWLANQLAAAPDPEEAFKRALQLAREGINLGFRGGYGPGGGGPTTLSPSTSPTGSIIQRYGGGPGLGPNPGTTPPGTTGPGWGYLSPSDGGPGWGTTGGLPFNIPGGPMGDLNSYWRNELSNIWNVMPPGGFQSPGDVPFNYSGDPMDFVAGTGSRLTPLYDTPGDVPYWYQGDPMDLVNPYL